MPAHTLTINFPSGRGVSNITGLDPDNSATATHVGEVKRLIGPPLLKELHTQGVYMMETSGTSGSFRWIHDQPIDLTLASPTTFSYVGCPLR